MRYNKFAVHGAEGQVQGSVGAVKPGRGGTFGARRGAQYRRGEGRVCFYCLNAGHFIADCKAWKKNNASAEPKSVGFVQNLAKICVIWSKDGRI